ncbi:MAG TPA: hypothetical protein VGG78_04160 [Gemmatimonadaceae bacterium]
MSRMIRSFLTSLAVLASVVTAVPAYAQRAGESGLIDPRSGRFSTRVFANEPARDPDTLSASAATVWAALPAVYDTLAVPLTLVDTASRVLGAVRVAVRRPIAGNRLSFLLECGTGVYGPAADSYAVQLTLVSVVRPVDATHSALETRVEGDAAQNGVNSSVHCGSTGRLEAKVVQLLRKELGL